MKYLNNKTKALEESGKIAMRDDNFKTENNARLITKISDLVPYVYHQIHADTLATARTTNTHVLSAALLYFLPRQ